MTEILQREVWFAEFPFSENSLKSKERPVIVLDVDDENCRVLSMKVTSSAPFGEFEITLYDWAKIPLHHESTANAADVKLIPKSQFRRKIGRLSDDDWENVTDLYVKYLESQGLNIE